MKKLSFFFVLLMIGMEVVAQVQQASYQQFRLIAREGPLEAASIGSYDLRINRLNQENPENPELVTGLVHERNGGIIKVWLLDLNEDNLLEALVWTQSAGTGSYGNLDLFTFDGKILKEQEILWPQDQHIEDYADHDDFSIEQGKVIRRVLLWEKDLKTHIDAIEKNKLNKLVLVYQKNSWQWRKEE